MGEGQSKPIKIKNRRTERGRLEQKEELEETERVDLQKRCVPKALQEERRPRNLATMGVPPTTPTAQMLPDPRSPANRGEGNLVRSDSAILRASGMPGPIAPLVRSNSNIVVPVAKTRPQQVLVRSNSSIILSSGAVQAVRTQNLQRSDSSVISATVAAAQAQNMERTNSMTLPARPPTTPVGGQAQSNMGRAVSLVVPKPAAPSLIPPVGGYPKSYAMPAKAPPTSASFVRPAVQAPTGPAVTTQTSSQVPGIAMVPGVATGPSVVTAPPKWNEVALAPSSVTVVKAAPTTQKASMPVLKVRATREERDMISQSAQMTQVSQGPSATFTSAAVPQPQETAPVTLMQAPPTMNLKWTPPPEGTVQYSAPPAQQVRVRASSPRAGHREKLTGSLQTTPLRWVSPQVNTVPAVVRRSASSQRSSPKLMVIGAGDPSTKPAISPRGNPSPDAKAAEPVGGPSLVRALAAKYEDAQSMPAPQPAFDPSVATLRDMDTHYQGSSLMKNAMQEKPDGQLWV